jgi:hypothetical protein
VGSEWERRTCSRSDFPIISSMRKGGKTAPAWAKNSCSMRKKLLQHAQRWENGLRMGKKLLQYAQKTIAACAKVRKQPPHAQKTLAACAKTLAACAKVGK